MTSPRGDCDQLGCCGEPDLLVRISYRCGRVTLCDIENPTAVSFGRGVDSISQATIIAAVSSDAPDCCDCLSELRTWCHEVAIYRCGELQWSGPITRLAYFPDRVEIVAQDHLAWLGRLPVTAEYDVAEETDISEVAFQMIQANLGDEGAGCMVFDVRPTGIVTDNFFSEEGTTVLAELERLRDEYGLHYTSVGRRLVLMGDAPLSLLGSLTDEDFAGEIAVIEDGMDATTFAQVTNNGGVVLGQAETVGVCGFLGSVVATSLEDEEEGQALAERIVAGGYPTPLRVEVPDGASLSPEAPICLHELVPGVDVRVVSTATCREAQADLRLSSLTFDVGPEGETISVSLAPRTLVAAG